MANSLMPPPKNVLRDRIRAARAALAGVGGRQSALAERVATFTSRHSTVIAYAALPGEPNIDSALDDIRARGATVLLPVTGRRGEPLSFGRLAGPMASLAPHGPFGIREPEPEFPAAEVLAAFPNRSPTLVLVPGLAFSTSGARLGHGGGYYDRTFGPYGAAPLVADSTVDCVGVCFEEEFGHDVHAEEWDLVVGCIITEKGLHVVG